MRQMCFDQRVAEWSRLRKPVATPPSEEESSATAVVADESVSAEAASAFTSLSLRDDSSADATPERPAPKTRGFGVTPLAAPALGSPPPPPPSPHTPAPAGAAAPAAAAEEDAGAFVLHARPGGDGADLDWAAVTLILSPGTGLHCELKGQLKADFKLSLCLLFRADDAGALPHGEGPPAALGCSPRRLKYSVSLPLRNIDRWAGCGAGRIEFRFRSDRMPALEAPPAPTPALPLTVSAARSAQLQAPPGAAAKLLEQLRAALQPNKFHAAYALGERLGSGGFGDCFRGRCHAGGGGDVAVKLPNAQAAINNGGRPCFAAEAEALRCVTGTSEFVIQLIDYFALRECGELREYLVLELMEGGSLLDLAEARAKAGRFVTEAEARVVAWRVLRGLEDMQRLRMPHRDVKPDNIMMARRGPDGLGDPATAKLGDLGHARVVDLGAGESLRTYSLLGTPAYNPPERVRAAQAGAASEGISAKGDAWALGCTIFAILTNTFPFGQPPSTAAILAGAWAPGPNTLAAARLAACSPAAHDFLAGLLRVDERQRLGAAQALQHAWFTVKL
jgi:hypothetical protein